MIENINIEQESTRSCVTGDVGEINGADSRGYVGKFFSEAR